MAVRDRDAMKAPTVSLRLTIVSLLLCVTISFLGGCAFRTHFLPDLNSPSVSTIKTTDVTSEHDYNASIPVVTVFAQENLETIYTTKDFDMANEKEIFSFLPERILLEKEVIQDGSDDDDEEEEEDDDDDDDDEEEEEDDDDDVSLQVKDTSGQQLRVVVLNLEREQLKNEHFLLKKMVDILSEASLPGPLSYHCHSISTTGVSCVGTLGNLPGRGHFSFYTWPQKLSLYFQITIMPTPSLLYTVPIFQRAFGVKDPSELQTCSSADFQYSKCADADPNQPKAIWKISMLGFRRKTKRLAALLNDIAEEVLDTSPMEYLKEVTSAQSIFQRIDIYDYMDPKRGHSFDQYIKSFAGDDSYESQHPELFQPERIVFLDGVAQSTRTADEGYHETLVQPAMFAHPNPRRVAIIGGGEGATLREVLRHKTIEHVKMIEIDQIMCEVSREFLPSWSDCSDLVGSSENCFDEPRADVIYENAIAWFADRTFYPRGSNEFADDPMAVEQFDVVIVDALDPQDTAEFCDILYKDDSFLSSVFRSLTKDGIMVMQLGPAPDFVDPAEELSLNANRVLVFQTLERFGFASMQVYEEHHCGFEDAWAFVIACKDINCRDNWYASESTIDLAIRKRLIETKSKKPSLKHFDGATMNKYQFSVRHWETVYCRSPTTHPDCGNFDGYNPEARVITSENFEVKEGGLITKIDIQNGDLLMVDEQVHSMHFSANAVNIAETLEERFEAFGSLIDYMDEYEVNNGLKYEANEVFTPSSLLNLAADSDDGNVGNSFLHSSQTKITPDGIINVNVFNPIVSRRFKQVISTFQAKKSIEAGEFITI